MVEPLSVVAQAGEGCQEAIDLASRPVEILGSLETLSRISLAHVGQAAAGALQACLTRRRPTLGAPTPDSLYYLGGLRTLQADCWRPATADHRVIGHPAEQAAVP